MPLCNKISVENLLRSARLRWLHYLSLDFLGWNQHNEGRKDTTFYIELKEIKTSLAVAEAILYVMMCEDNSTFTFSTDFICANLLIENFYRNQFISSLNRDIE